MKTNWCEAFVYSMLMRICVNQWDPCIIRIANLKVNFTKKKCALYTGKYGKPKKNKMADVNSRFASVSESIFNGFLLKMYGEFLLSL